MVGWQEDAAGRSQRSRFRLSVLLVFVALGRQHPLPVSGVNRLSAHGRRLPVLMVTAAMVLGAGVALEVFEVRVIAGLLCRDAAGGIVDKHHLEEVKTCVVKVGTEGCRGVARPLREGSLEVGVTGHAGPDLLGGGSKKATDAKVSLDGGQNGEWKTYRKILKISSISESPGKSGLRVHISAKMHPTDHMSTPVEY